MTSDSFVFNNAGPVTVSASVAGTGSLSQNGAGNTTLSGTNIYSGATTVSVGTLLVNGDGSGATGAMAVSSGATLGGNGTLGGAVTVASTGILLAGDGTTGSTLTSGKAVTMLSGSVIEISLGATLADHSSLHRAAGTWAFNSSTHQAFTLDNHGAITGNYTGLITGLTGSEAGLSDIASWTITNPGWSGTFSYSGGSVDLNLLAVPEPSIGSLLFGSIAALLLLRARRKPPAA